MGGIRDTFKGATAIAGHSNVLEYVNSLSDVCDFPRTVDSQTVCQMFSGKFRWSESYSEYYKDGVFFDKWGQPIVVTLTTNHAGTGYVILHSFGKNKKDEKGDGDDLMMWFNADDTDLGAGNNINNGQPPK